MEQNALVAAANVKVRKSLGAALRERGYKVTLSGSGKEALRFCKSISVNLAVIDTQLPDRPAFKLKASILRQRPQCRVLVLANFGRVRGTPDQLQFGEDHYLVDGSQLMDLVGREAAPEEGAGPPGFAQMGNAALIETIDLLVGLLELDDRYVSGGSHRAAALAQAVAERMIPDPHGIEEVQLATLLRDIGRSSVPDNVLEESGELNPIQHEAMQQHVEVAIRLLDHIQYPWKLMPILRHHHERYDGTGYPDGLRGREIPLGARIVSVVDAYVAMTSPRRHREALAPDDALSELIRLSGHQFDPEVVESLQGVLAERLLLTSRAGQTRILLVDSDDAFCTGFKLKLDRAGYQVTRLAGYGEGLGLGQDAPDLVLCDIDGDPNAAFGMLHEMRGEDGDRRLPFIFLSSENERTVRMRALREGVDDYLLKDVSLEDLVARVGNVLTREAVRADGSIHRERKGIYGSLDNLSLPDIVQTLSVGLKTARVSLDSKGRDGSIWFENGQPVSALCGDESGAEAFYELVTWSEGDFHIEHGLLPDEPNLSGDAMFLLMEGLRRYDESTKAAS